MGKIFYLMGKSSSGKDTIYKELLQGFPKMKRIVLYTTRPRREGECDGVEYFFTDEEKSTQSRISIHDSYRYRLPFSWNVLWIYDAEQGFFCMVSIFYEYVYLCRFYGICDSQSSVVGIQSDRGIFSGSGGQCQTFILWTFHAG